MNIPDLHPYGARFVVRLSHPAAPDEQQLLLAELLEWIGRGCATGDLFIGHIKAIATQPSGSYITGSLTSAQAPAQVDGNLQEGDQLDVKLAVLVYGLDYARLAWIVGQAWQELIHTGRVLAAIQQDLPEEAGSEVGRQVLQMHFAPEIDLDWFWRFEGVDGDSSRQPSRASLRTASNLRPEALGLAYPVAHALSFKVGEVQKKRLVLENGTVFNGGFVGHILSGAHEIAVVVATIGDKLEARSRRYFEEGRPARGYLLDGLGTVALGTLAERVRQEIEAGTKARGLTASTPISPGHADWKLEEQGVLFELLRGSQTGVTLNTNYLMSPRKSFSMVIGVGEMKLTHAESTQCEYCSLQKTCTYRRLPGEEWYLGHTPDEEVFMDIQ